MYLGYPVISLSLLDKDVRPFRDLVGNPDEVSAILQQNLRDLKSVLEWNESVGVKFYRLSNTLAHRNIEALPEAEKILEMISEIGNYARANGHRLSFHCSHYAVLCSPKSHVRAGARAEIEAQSKFFDLLGYEATHWNKINIHIGGAYGNKADSLEKWIASWEKLSESAKKRLVVENDDRASLYSVQDLYEGLHQKIGVPITFDSFHHNFCNSGESKAEAAEIAASTWKGVDPCFHFASSRNLNEQKSLQTAHADWVYEDILNWNTNAWVMVESGARDLAVLRYLKEGVQSPFAEKIILETVQDL